MTALGGGRLFVEDGRIRMVGRRYRGKVYSWLVVWPYGYSLRRSGGEVLVLDGKGEAVARVGDEVRMGGGEITRDMFGSAPKASRYREGLGVPDRCRWPLWVASPGVRVVREG